MKRPRQPDRRHRPRPVALTVRTRGFFLLATLVAAGSLASVLPAWRVWFPVWAELDAAFAMSLLLTGPAVAAVGGWTRARDRADGLAQIWAASPRNSALVEVHRIGELGTAVVAGFIAAYAGCAVVLAPRASVGGPNLASLLSQVAFLALCLTLGRWTGTRLSALLAGPTAAVAVYLVLGALAFAQPEILSAVTPLDSRGQTFYDVPWYLTLLLSAALLTSAWAAVLASARLGRRAVPTAWAAGLLFAPLLFIGDGDLQPNYSAAELTCRDSDALVLCLPRAKDYLRGDVSSWVREVQTLTAPLVPEGSIFVDDEAITSTSDLPPDDGRGGYFRFSEFSDLSGASTPSKDEVQASLLLALFPGSSATSLSGNDAAPNDIILLWAFQRLGIAADGSAFVGAPPLVPPLLDYGDVEPQQRWFEGLSRDDRNRWFTEHAAEIADGALMPDDFGTQ